MTKEHPNVLLMKQLNLRDLSTCKDLFADNAVFHYFNPNLPDLQGDYVGLDGIRSFFEAIGRKSRGTFNAEPVSITAVGDELVVTHTRNTLTLQDLPVALDVVAVWRFVQERIVEVWDIVPGHRMEPILHTMRVGTWGESAPPTFWQWFPGCSIEHTGRARCAHS